MRVFFWGSGWGMRRKNITGGTLHLLAAVDEALLDRGDALLLLDLFLDLRHLVVALDVELDLLARQGPDSAKKKWSVM